jgi:hypothetical protein
MLNVNERWRETTKWGLNYQLGNFEAGWFGHFTAE